jgi:hypothetical protein
MAVTTFHDFPLGPRDRKRDGAAAEKRIRARAGAEDGRHVAVPRAVIAAVNTMPGAHGGIGIPQSGITRARNHLAKYYEKMGETAPWERDR